MAVVLLVFLASSCSGVELASRVRNFSVELTYFTHLHFDNFVLSPLCVWNTMSCVGVGANGDTNTQIRRAFLIPRSEIAFVNSYKNLTGTLLGVSTSGVKVMSSMFAFVDSDAVLRPSYKILLSQLYDADVKVLDLKDATRAASIANSFIQSRIPFIENVFHDDDFVDATMIMSNVIRFRGTLTLPFNRSLTTEELVYDERNVTVGTVTVMRQRAKVPYSNLEAMKSHAMELSYGDDGKFCMLFILPYPGITASEAYSKLDKITIPQIFDKLQKDVEELGLREIEVNLPRFSIRTSVTFNKPLNDMGIYDAFEPDQAKFNDISNEDMYIDTVEGRAMLTFREAETVATASVPGYFDKRTPAVKHKAKQPFIFFLLEKSTLTIIYSGIYSKHYHLNELSSTITFKDN